MATDSQIDDLVESSKIIFIGSVQRLASTTIPTHPNSSSTVVVRVNRVLHAPPALGDLIGQQVTVELTGGPGLRVGQQAIFFTNGVVYGDSIVVQEVGRLAVAPDPASQQAQVAAIAAAIKNLPDKHIQARLQAADVVVTGKIVSIKPADRARGPISEHDPDWREAVLDVESVESGLPMKQLVFFFPASRDVRWRQVPKFSVGQEGVFILQRHQIKELKTPGYVVLHPLDFHPKQRRDHIRALIQRR
jgi:hypothetical protein